MRYLKISSLVTSSSPLQRGTAKEAYSKLKRL